MMSIEIAPVVVKVSEAGPDIRARGVAGPGIAVRLEGSIPRSAPGPADINGETA